MLRFRACSLSPLCSMPPQPLPLLRCLRATSRGAAAGRGTRGSVDAGAVRARPAHSAHPPTPAAPARTMSTSHPVQSTPSRSAARGPDVPAEARQCTNPPRQDQGREPRGGGAGLVAAMPLAGSPIPPMRSGRCARCMPVGVKTSASSAPESSLPRHCVTAASCASAKETVSAGGTVHSM